MNDLTELRCRECQGLAWSLYVSEIGRLFLGCLTPNCGHWLPVGDVLGPIIRDLSLEAKPRKVI